MAATLLQFPVREANPNPAFFFEGALDVEREEGSSAFNLVFEDIGTITLRPFRVLQLAAMLNVEYKGFRAEDGARILKRALLGDAADRSAVIPFQAKAQVVA